MKTITTSSLACCLLLLTLFSATPAEAQSCSYAASTSEGHSVTLLDVTYSQGPNGCESTWSYEVTGDDGPPAISHVLFGSENCLDCLNDADDVISATVSTIDEPAVVVGQDGSTPYCGIKFDDGWEQGETRILTFTLNGAYNVGTITFVAKAGSGYTTAEICGPVCETPVCETGVWDPSTCGCGEPPCVCTSPPANITITPIGNDQIQVCWDAQECAEGFIVQYQWKGHEDWNIIEVPGDQNCATIDLKGHVEVTVEVSTICEDGSITDKSSPIVYTYNGPCLAPSGMSTTDITSTSATLNWTPGTTTHVQKIQLSRTGYPSVSIGVGDGIGSYTVSGLIPSTSYKWKVKGDCWSTAKKFTTAAQKTDGISTESPSVSMKVYPNPASNMLKADISLSDESDQDVTIHLVNTLGQILLSTNKTISGGHSIISLSLGSEVKDGMYTLQVISGDKTISQRIIISND